MTEAEPFLARPWLTGLQGIDLVLPLEYARAAAAAGDAATAARRTYQELLGAVDRRRCGLPAAAAGARRAGPPRVVGICQPVAAGHRR